MNGWRESPLALLALGVTVVAAALALHPVRASPLVFWLVMAVGLVALVAGLLAYLRRGPRRELVASECRRIHGAIKKLLEEQDRRRPRSGRFNNGHDRRDEWSAETVSRYEHELYPWATRVFDQAVKVDALSEASRPMLSGRTVLQLATLRELFRDAAEELERT